jgi:hypothetical protein
VRTWEELREAMREAGCPRVFVKLAHSSSASGVLALAQGARGADLFGYRGEFLQLVNLASSL